MIQLTNEQHRAILLLEALGLVHDIGKLSDKFLVLKSQFADKNGDFHYDLFVDPSKVDLFKGLDGQSDQNNARKKVTEWKEWAKTPHKCAFSERSDFTDILNSISITDWHGTSYTLAELAPFVMKPGYGNRDWSPVLGKSMEPGLLVGAMHGVAHIDKPGVASSEPQPYDDMYRATPFGYETRINPGSSSKILSNLPLQNLETVTSCTRERRAWLKNMKTGLDEAIADTQRPLNDVTLWDWGYLVASLTKAAARYLFISGNEQTAFKDIPLSVLRINIDFLDLYTYSDRISDLLGKKAVLENAFNAVREIIEFDWALGNRLYHDETGAYYLLPDGIWTTESKERLREIIQDCFPKDLLPRVHFGERVLVGELDKQNAGNRKDRLAAIEKLIANPRKKAGKDAAVMAGSNLYHFEDEWSRSKPDNAEICSVCGKYPVGYQGSDTAFESWVNPSKAKERHVCCCCLSRRRRRAEEWGEKKVNTEKVEPTIWTDEVVDKNGRFALFTGMFALDEWLDGSALEATRLSNNTARYPSPALLFRIAETAREFWKKTSGDLLVATSGEREHRLRLYPENPEAIDLGKYHTYELTWGNRRVGVVWDGAASFISVENLERTSSLLGFDISDLLTAFSGPCTLRIPSSFGNPGKVAANLIIRSVEKTGSYIPAIPLVTEPSLCMALLPADRALYFVEKVIESYQDEMNRVQDRFPLGIGLVFCPSRTPIRSVMEAGTAMREMLKSNQDEVWQIVEASGQNGSADLKFKNGIRMSFRKTFGDSSPPEKDRWFRHHVRLRSDVPIKISEIRKGQSLKVKPGRFDFEFLDTSGRRFDIVYGREGKRPDPSRPWDVADFTRLIDLWQNHFRFLSPTQRNQVIGLIETKRKEWSIVDNDDKVFKRFVEDTLAGANWPHTSFSVLTRFTSVQEAIGSDESITAWSGNPAPMFRKFREPVFMGQPVRMRHLFVKSSNVQGRGKLIALLPIRGIVENAKSAIRLALQ